MLQERFKSAQLLERGNLRFGKAALAAAVDEVRAEQAKGDFRGWAYESRLRKSGLHFPGHLPACCAKPKPNVYLSAVMCCGVYLEVCPLNERQKQAPCAQSG